MTDSCQSDDLGVRLRPYQREAIYGGEQPGILPSLARHRSTLCVSPTGTGKTILFAGVVHHWDGRVLVMAHRDELIRQAADKIERVTGESCDIEMADAYADQRSLHNRAKCVVTSVQTMSRPRRHARFHPEEFSLVIVDEAHHAVAKTYQSVIEHFGQAKVLGVTATPDRTDERALGRVFESVAFEYGLPEAIDDGWLVPIWQRFIEVDKLDLSLVGTVARDLNQGHLATVMEDAEVLGEVVVPTMEIAGDEQTLVFCVSVKQAEAMSDLANGLRNGCAQWVCGDQVKTPRELRRDILRRFHDRQFQFLFNVGVLTEGFDEPNVGVVAIARPTTSRSLYAQMAGRGTRTVPGIIEGLASAEERRAAIAASSKPGVLLLDFVGNAGRHKLVHAGDILGGDYEDSVIAEATRAVAAASTRGERQDMLAALRQAEECRQKQLRDAHAKLVARAKYRVQDISPFDVYDIAPKREPGWHTGRQPTDKQKAYLEKCGVPTKNLSFHQASQLIDESFKRRTAGLCSFKQAKILKRFGLGADVTFAEASRLIDAIAANGWRPLTARV